MASHKLVPLTFDLIVRQKPNLATKGFFSFYLITKQSKALSFIERQQMCFIKCLKSPYFIEFSVRKAIQCVKHPKCGVASVTILAMLLSQFIHTASLVLNEEKIII
jgi:hypothetical protein